MEKWCSGNLRGLSQKTPRQRSEKDNPETLPIQEYAVSTPSIVEPVCIHEENACQDISQSHQDLRIELELPVKLSKVWPTEHEQKFVLHKSSKQLVRKKDESIENGEELVTVIKYGTSITDSRVLLKEGEFRCNIDDLTLLDVEVSHNNQGEGEIVISQGSYSKNQEKLFERVPVDSFYIEAGNGDDGDDDDFTFELLSNASRSRSGRRIRQPRYLEDCY